MGKRMLRRHFVMRIAYREKEQRQYAIRKTRNKKEMPDKYAARSISDGSISPTEQPSNNKCHSVSPITASLLGA